MSSLHFSSWLPCGAELSGASLSDQMLGSPWQHPTHFPCYFTCQSAEVQSLTAPPCDSLRIQQFLQQKVRVVYHPTLNSSAPCTENNPRFFSIQIQSAKFTPGEIKEKSNHLHPLDVSLLVIVYITSSA